MFRPKVGRASAKLRLTRYLLSHDNGRLVSTLSSATCARRCVQHVHQNQTLPHTPRLNRIRRCFLTDGDFTNERSPSCFTFIFVTTRRTAAKREIRFTFVRFSYILARYVSVISLVFNRSSWFESFPPVFMQFKPLALATGSRTITSDHAMYNNSSISV